MQEVLRIKAKDGRAFKVVYDEEYQTVGSFAYDTEKETKDAEDKEIQMIASGYYAAFGIRVYEKHSCNCPYCPGTGETDSIWGCVYANNEQGARLAIEHNFGPVEFIEESVQ